MSVMLLAAACLRPCPADEAVPDPTSVMVATAGGEVIAGHLLSLSDALEIQTDGEQTQRLDWDALISVSTSDPQAKAGHPDTFTLLVNGDVLGGRPLGVSEEALTLEWTGTQPSTELIVPLEFVRTIVYAQPKEEIERERLQRQWALTQAETDRLLLLNGTYVDGEFAGADAGNVNLTTKFGELNTARNEVAAVTMNTSLAAETSLPKQYSILLSVDGSRVTLTNVHMKPSQGLTGRALFGEDLHLPMERLIRLQLFGDRVQSLAQRPPQNYVFTPYFTEQHPLATNRNVHGGPLQLRGVTFATGLGMHTKSDVTYDLTGAGFRSFTATIGVDDMADGQGHVLFAVAVDGNRVFESGGVTGRDALLPVGPIDITGAERLTLSVDFGRMGNIRDIADWCDPLLIK